MRRMAIGNDEVKERVGGRKREGGREREKQAENETETWDRERERN